MTFKKNIINKKFVYPILLLLIIVSIYYKFFVFQKIPFPGDLLISSYSPWFDYYKLPVKNPVISDVFSQIFLWKYLSIEQIKNLKWPLWNPYSFTGTPLLATYQSASLYPLNMFLLIPKHIGWGLFIFSQTAIAALGMYLFLSIWLESKIARTFGALTFAFAGLMTTWIELGTAVHAISWLPYSLYFVEKYISSLKNRFLLLLSLSITMTILAGFAQVTIYAFIIITSYGLIKLFNKNGVELRRLLAFFISLLLPLGISAPQLFPSLDLLQESIRINDSYIETLKFGLLPLKDILKLFQGDYFGNIVTGNYWGGFNYIENSLFVGTINLPFLIYSIFFLKKNKIIIFFISLFIISLILIFQNPISSLLYKTKIPLLTLSFASRAILITTFSLSILSAFSLNHFITNTNQIRNLYRCFLWSIMALIGITIGTLIVKFIVEIIISQAPNKFYEQFYLNDYDFKINNFNISLRNQILPFLQIFTPFTLIIVLMRVKNRVLNEKLIPILSLIFLVSLSFDMGRYFLKLNPFVDKSLIFPTTPSIEYLQKQSGFFRVGRENAEVLPPNTWMAYNLQSFEGYDPIYLNNYSRFINFINNGELNSSGFGRYAELTNKKYDSPYLDILNVKFFMAILRDNNGYTVKNQITENPEKYLDYRFKQGNLKVVFYDKSSAVLENPNVLERAYLAPSITYTFKNNVDPRKVVTLSKDLNIENVSGKGTVKILSYEPNKVEIETYTNQDEILVLADQYENGWKAKVDGKQTEISPANLVQRAVGIPKGNHRVIFYYYPKSFDIGLKLFAATILLLSGITLISIKSKTF